MQAGTCTTAPVTVDKSNYWIPQLYYFNPTDQSYTMIPVSFLNTYYLDRPGVSGVVQAFPDGLRMIAGNGDRRTFDSSDPDDQAISYVCLDYTASHTGDPAWAQRNNFFAQNCPSGMRAQVNFPNCWDGVNLDSNDHHSHTAWPSGGVNGGDCPSSHPVHLVSLFYEFIFEVQNFPYNNASEPTWVWSNGDTTGYGLHADFINGWPTLVNGTNVLQEAINQCNANEGVGGELGNCPPLAPYINTDGANACRPQNALVDEDVGSGHSIPFLPGDNPIWIGNVTKPSFANYTDDGINLIDATSTIPTGYTEIGCIAEGTSGRALTAASFSNNNMTRGACVSYCQAFGFPFAGVEFGLDCYCGTSMQNGASNTTLLADSSCGMPCANNTYENCGGSNTLTLFNNPRMYPSVALPTGWVATGCKTEATSGRALTGYYFTSSAMTNELCITTCQSKGYTMAGAEFANECYCGDSFATGSVKADGTCTMPCAGNSLESCGAGNRLTTFNYTLGLASLTPAVTLPTGWASLGCMTDVTSTRSLAQYSFASSSMTRELCMSTCLSKGYTLAGAEYADECYCGNSFTTGTATAASGDCAMDCSGNETEICGGPNRISAFNYTVGIPVAPASMLPAGWASLGCMTDAQSTRSLSQYSFTSSSMTQELCMSTCLSKGYTLAGAEYTNECYCGNSYTTGATTAASTDCAMICNGELDARCHR